MTNNGSGAPNLNESGDLWIFAYGSLRWRPGFEYVVRGKATLYGWRRRLCIWSQVYRGNPEKPGLVLGLDLGGQCEGVAYLIDPSIREATLAYLRERELVSGVYDERSVAVRLASGEAVNAVTYTAKIDHPQYAHPMAPEETIAIIKAGVGISGNNIDYVRNTNEHLLQLRIIDQELRTICELL